MDTLTIDPGKLAGVKFGYQGSFFRNVKISELNEPFDVVEKEDRGRTIDTWNLSEQFEVNFYSQNEIHVLYHEQRTNAKWKTIKADRDGRVNISRFYEYPRNAVFAISEIYSLIKDQIEQFALALRKILSDFLGYKSEGETNSRH